MKKRHLTKQDAQKIVKFFCIGKLKNLTPIQEGNVNTTYSLSTSHGEFIVQIIGDEYSKWRENRIKIQFELIRYLKLNGFPYELPIPKTGKGNKSIMKLGRDYLRVYEKIEGKSINNFDIRAFKESVKVLAIFHKYSENFKWPGKEDAFSLDINNLLKAYLNFKISKSANDIDHLFLENLNLFKKCLFNIKKTNFKMKKQAIHADFNRKNIIFDKIRAVGIIDFDSIEYSYVSRDIAITIKKLNYPAKANINDKISLFLKEYRKYNSFPKIYEKTLLPLMLWAELGFLLWYYEGIEDYKIKKSLILNSIKEIKIIAKARGWAK